MKGRHNPVKKKKILHQLRQVSCQIAFLQETHLSDVEHQKLKKSHGQINYITPPTVQGERKESPYSYPDKLISQKH